LGNDVHTASAGDIANFTHNLHFEHMWHHV
jgi:hypothetical protein